MVSGPPIARLIDIIEAIELIKDELDGVTIEALESNKRKRWLVERGLEIILEASRRLPEAMKTNHPTIPWPKIAGIGNILRHEYEHLAHDVLRRVATNALPIFETVCRNELSAEQSRITLRDGRAS